jgi:hypothetical protein
MDSTNLTVLQLQDVNIALCICQPEGSYKTEIFFLNSYIGNLVQVVASITI